MSVVRELMGHMSHVLMPSYGYDHKVHSRLIPKRRVLTDFSIQRIIEGNI